MKSSRFLPSSLLFAFAFLPAGHGQNTGNPFTSPIVTGNVVADLEVFATIPNSNNSAPRVNELTYAPNGQLFANDQRGPLYSLTPQGGVTPYLDLRTSSYGLSLVADSERGFQSFAFHPDFNSLGAPGYGKFYTVSSTSNTAPTPTFTPGGGDNPNDEILLEWTTSTPGSATFTPANSAAPYREIIRWERPYTNHTVGLVAFNPNATAGSADYGKLYIASGDGGSGGDPLNLAQNQQSAFGKILRIDPLGTNSANGRYGIPSDNPFVGSPTALDENWASGFRNPQRFSWDRGGSGEMFIGDIGQGVIEEINRGVAGANYGWRQKEGSYTYINGGTVGANTRNSGDGLTYPIAEYDHSEGAAITAGFVLRNAGLAGLEGQFLFGDLQNGRVFFFDPATMTNGGQNGITELRLRLGGVEMDYLDAIRLTNPNATRADLRFGMDLDGDVYLLNKQNGRIYALVPEPGTLAILFGGMAALGLRRRRKAIK